MIAKDKNSNNKKYYLIKFYDLNGIEKYDKVWDEIDVI